MYIALMYIALMYISANTITALQKEMLYDITNTPNEAANSLADDR